MRVPRESYSATTSGCGCSTIPTQFEAQVARTPGAIAVAGPAGVLADGVLTYRELNSRANQLARYLVAHDAGPERLVGLVLDRTVDAVIAILATLKAGAAYLPIDPVSPPGRILGLLADACPVHILMTANVSIPNMSTTWLAGGVFLERLRAYDDSDLAPSLLPDNPAYVIYTSGSAGEPKGVVVTHKNVARLFGEIDRLFRFRADDVWVLFHSYAFDFSVWELWGSLLNGGRLVVVPYMVSRSPRAFLKMLRREKVTILNQTPSAFYQLMDADQVEADSESLELKDSLALRYVFFGGETLDLKRLVGWYTRHSDSTPTLVNMYGITETTVHVTYIALNRQLIADAQGSLIGAAIPDLELHLLDDKMEPVPPGVPGEVYVSGGGLARGYLNRPSLTATRFVSNPFGGAGSRLYRTGDVARIQLNGAIEFLGRADYQVKVRGHRIELREIEEVLRSCTLVDDAVVVAREDRAGDRRLVAYVTGPGVSNVGVYEWARSWLPDYMVPSAYVVLDSFPLTVNGKLDRQSLPAPSGGDVPSDVDFVAPSSRVEMMLAEIWEEVLGIERIGIDDNFFTLGGHSLLAAQIISRVRERLGVDIPLQILYGAPTIAELANRIAGDAPGQEPTIEVL
ncbi:amino acid adenylation domain-containing protein [Nocardia arthritidis]|nr:amino acid adenylation domain-containing protein [Nocardia arthritidis]